MACHANLHCFRLVCCIYAVATTYTSSNSIICSESLLLLQRNAVDAWDMKGARPAFSQKRELQGLELPKGTVIEVELVQELQGEVSDLLGLKRESRLVQMSQNLLINFILSCKHG